MSQKNFSLLLALRYLNPIRTNVSVITIISLLGVAAGVMVLVVSLSVMNGFERLLKDIVLTSRPHIYLEHRSVQVPDIETIEEDAWREKIETLESIEYITSVSPLITDFVGLELGATISPRQMVGVDTGNEDELLRLSNNLKDGDVEALQQGDKALISSKLQDSAGISVGDIILLHSSSNIKQVIPVYKRLDEPAFNEVHAENISDIIEKLEKDDNWTITEEGETIPYEFASHIANNFIRPHLKNNNLRQAEIRILQSIFKEFKNFDVRDVENGIVTYSPGARDYLIQEFKELQLLKKEEMDSGELRNLKAVVLPKEVEVVGVLQTNNFASVSDIFVPFDVAQDLVDLDGGIQGLSISLTDHTQASHFKDLLASDPDLSIGNSIEEYYSKDKDWNAITWMESSQQLFKVMEMQKFMMVFVLSFIVLVAVFSIAAVMFTVAIQKKREIGVMKALGATPSQIINVFAYQGVFVGFFGALLGLGIGLLIVLNIAHIQRFIKNQLHFNPFPQNIYGTETMPTHIIPMEFIVVGCGALILCTIASLLPAWAASRADAARSLRNL